MSYSKKILALSGTLAVCCLALTGTLALAQNANTKTTVRYPTGHAVSRPLRELPIDVLGLGDVEAPEPKPIPLSSRGVVGPAKPDAVLQKEVRPNVSATKGIDFDGIGAQGFAPSDVNLAIGPSHIVQTVNVRLAVYNKSGAILSGPTNFTTFFAPVGGNCAAGASDPIVNYDRLADRWVISDIGISASGTIFQSVAVSAPMIHRAVHAVQFQFWDHPESTRNWEFGRLPATAPTLPRTTSLRMDSFLPALNCAVSTAPKCWPAMRTQHSFAR